MLLLLRNHYLKSEEPIIVSFLSFMILIAKNTDSESDSLF